ncbi:MAG: radical SAM protein [Oscillospiraceae bacterium]|nr:radical SAM protein [Oscillospiraceae bacterium]
MSLETMRKIVKAKIPIITLSGGEPTEHPLFYEIVREIETQKIALNIITNCENTDLIIKTVKKKKNTNVIVSINQYDNPSRIRFIEEHVQLLTKEKFRVYLNIPVDCNNIDFNVVHRFQNLLKSVNRIYITKYVIDECNISTSDFENIKKLALYIKKNFAIANVMYTIPCSRSMLYVANFFAWLIGETFDPCSGYPFRSTVNERGVYVKCLREKKNAR